MPRAGQHPNPSTLTLALTLTLVLTLTPDPDPDPNPDPIPNPHPHQACLALGNIASAHSNIATQQRALELGVLDLLLRLRGSSSAKVARAAESTLEAPMHSQTLTLSLTLTLTRNPNPNPDPDPDP